MGTSLCRTSATWTAGAGGAGAGGLWQATLASSQTGEMIRVFITIEPFIFRAEARLRRLLDGQGRSPPRRGDQTLSNGCAGCAAIRQQATVPPAAPPGGRSAWDHTVLLQPLDERSAVQAQASRGLRLVAAHGLHRSPDQAALH